MSIVVRVAADAAGLKELQRAIDQTAQRGKKLNDIKLDKDQFKQAADELERAQRGIDAYLKTAHGRAAQRTARAAGFNPQNPLEWVFDDRMYASKGKQALELRRLVESIRKGDSQQHESSAVSDFMRSIGRAGSAGAGGLAQGASSGAGSLLRGGLIGLAAFGGYQIGSKIAGFFKTAAELHEKANLSVEGMYKTIGYGGPYEDLINASRDAAKHLGLLTHEAAELSTAFMRASGAADKGLIGRAEGAGMFARGYGVDPSSMVQRFAMAERLGVAGQNQQRFAAMIADAIAASPMRGNPELVMDDVLQGVQSISSRLAAVPTEAQMERFIALRGAQWQNPALRGQTGDRQLAAAQGLLSGQNPAQIQFIYDTFRKEIGSSIIAIEKLHGASIFQTAKEVFGSGDDQMTIIERMIENAYKWAQGVRDPGDPNASLQDRATLVWAKQNNISMQEARAFLDAMNKVGGVGSMRNWLKDHTDIDINKLNMRQFADMARLATGDHEALQDLKKKYLGKDVTIAQEDRDRLNAAQTDSELARVLPDIIARAGINDPADKLRQVQTEVLRYLEQQMGPDLFAVVMKLGEVKSEIVQGIVGPLKKIMEFFGVSTGDINEEEVKRMRIEMARERSEAHDKKVKELIKKPLEWLGIGDDEESQKKREALIEDNKQKKQRLYKKLDEFVLGPLGRAALAILGIKDAHGNMMPDGEILSGGSRSWRNNNPGNLEFGPFAKKHGAFATDGRFAIFPDIKAGSRAQTKLLVSRYGKSTIGEMVEKYAPSSENDTEAYKRAIENLSGLKRTDVIGNLTPDELERLRSAMARHEGWKEGNRWLPDTSKGTAAKAAPKWEIIPGKSQRIDGFASSIDSKPPSIPVDIDQEIRNPAMAGTATRGAMRHEGSIDLNIPQTDSSGRKRVHQITIAPEPASHNTGSVNWQIIPGGTHRTN